MCRGWRTRRRHRGPRTTVTSHRRRRGPGRSMAESAGPPPPPCRLQLIRGVSYIQKPYFNVGTDNVYTLLGRVQHRGLETSLSFNDGGLTGLVGGALLTPRN